MIQKDKGRMKEIVKRMNETEKEREVGKQLAFESSLSRNLMSNYDYQSTL